MQVPHATGLFGAVHTRRQSVKKADFQVNGEACSSGQFMRGANQRNLGFFDMVNILPPRLGAKFLRLKWRKFGHLASEVGGARNIFTELFGKNKAENTFWLDSSSTEKVGLLLSEIPCIWNIAIFNHLFILFICFSYFDPAIYMEFYF